MKTGINILLLITLFAFILLSCSSDNNLETSLQVLSTTPYTDQQNVPITSLISVTFNEVINDNSLNTNTFMVLNSDQQRIAGSVSIDDNTASFIPDSKLAYFSEYFTILDKSITGLNGNSLGSNYIWSFTTAEKPCDINIKQGQDRLISGSGEYVFNRLVTGSAASPVLFTIENNGHAELSVSQVSLTSGDISDFSIDSDILPLYIDGSENYDFSITFTPVSEGMKKATVTIISNDESNGSYSFSVKGYYGPELPRFKLVNSWGKDGIHNKWEKINDGFLWITSQALIDNNVFAVFYIDRPAYEPRYVAVFKISHYRRNSCEINLGLGQPANPFAVKTFPMPVEKKQIPFNDEFLIIDISDLGNDNDFNTNNVFLKVKIKEGIDSPESGWITEFSIERYNNYKWHAPLSPEKEILSSDSFPVLIPANSSEYGISTVITAGQLGSKSVLNKRKYPAVEKLVTGQLSKKKLEILKNAVGVKKEGEVYNKIIDGHGTGFIPPSDEDWDAIAKGNRYVKTLRKDIINRTAAGYPESIDLSQTKFFPPVADQGELGSCVAFVLGYYIKTFQEAKENNYDLSGVSWSGDNPGCPLNGKDKIFSPSFLYNLANGGINDGAELDDTMNIITNIGCATWDLFPYDVEDFTSWPDEDTWRQAALYQGAVPSDIEYNCRYYFSVENEEQIDILKMLLSNDILVAVAVDADYYKVLDNNDTWDSSNYNNVEPNHLNTIVGYVTPGK